MPKKVNSLPPATLEEYKRLISLQMPKVKLPNAGQISQFLQQTFFKIYFLILPKAVLQNTFFH